MRLLQSESDGRGRLVGQTSGMRPRLSAGQFAFAMVLALGALFLAVQPASSQTRVDDDGDIDIIAFGDSYTAGNGTWGPFTNVRCNRSLTSYPYQLRDGLVRDGYEVDKVDNYACSGAVTSDVWGQISAAGDRVEEADIILLTIGGNDLGFSSIVESCFALPTVGLANLPAFTSQEPCESLLSEARGELRNTLERTQAILAELQRRAPTAQITLVGYPRLASPTCNNVRDAGARELLSRHSQLVQQLQDDAERLTADMVVNIRVDVEVQRRTLQNCCLLYTSPSPRDQRGSRMPSSA